MIQQQPVSRQSRSHGLLKLPVNAHGRDFVVGDLHGQYDSFVSALDVAGFNENTDRVISVGDLIDRGPHSRRCLELLYEPWFYSVLGNHEDFFLSAFLEKDAGAMLALVQNGGGWTLDEDVSDLQALAADAMASLPVAIELPSGDARIGIIHAACSSARWGNFNVQADIWNRRIARRPAICHAPPKEAIVKGIDAVVVGHNIVDRPTITGNTLNLDAGAAMGRAVTVWGLEDIIRALRLHRMSNNVQTQFSRIPGSNESIQQRSYVSTQ